MSNAKNKYTQGQHCWNIVGVWSDVVDRCDRLEEFVHCRNCSVFRDAGREVFEKSAPVGYLSEWRKTLASEMVLEKNEDKSVLVFMVGGEWFAIPATCLNEIAEQRVVHRIPRNRNDDIEGIVNIGGEVRVCYSLESILDVKQLAVKNNKNGLSMIARHLVILLDAQYYVFRVEQVSGLCWYNDNDILPVPSTLRHEGAGVISGVINHNKNKVGIFDIDAFQARLEGIAL
jgi:chemotaxis-related protein WspD